MTLTILGLGGSPRSGSSTAMALRIALDGASQTGARTSLVDLATLRLPLFDGTYTLDGYTLAERKAILTLFDAVLPAGCSPGSPERVERKKTCISKKIVSNWQLFLRLRALPPSSSWGTSRSALPVRFP